LLEFFEGIGLTGQVVVDADPRLLLQEGGQGDAI
jgi:hypothetical protein